jgi:hypothetical protein
MIIIIYYFLIATLSLSSVSFFYFLYLQQDFYSNECLEDEFAEEKNTEEEVKKEEIKYEEKYIKQIKKYIESKSTDVVNLSEFQHLKNNFVMEKTPVGNVTMYFDSDTETFNYYSDNSIPYRFLEVVARKYVIMFHCIDIYIDMESELEVTEKKRILTEKEKKIKEEEDNINPSCKQKKNVFAKFKSYNKDGLSGRVNNAPPPKNSIPTKTYTSNVPILKEKANRYVCKGRFSIFPMIKHVDRKKIDKEYSMSFAEFKKKQIEKNLL